MLIDIVRKYSEPVPRYTSYPTAPHFSAGVGEAAYRDWLAALTPADTLSLYLHVPYCRDLCHYCGCNTKATHAYAPVAQYVHALLAEIDAVADCLPAGARVGHVHWGGGSPNVLSAEDISTIGARLHARFAIEPAGEHAVEIDPRRLDGNQVDAFVAIGVNRVSLGVQDFDPEVQRAIGREQSFATTRSVVERFRAAGVSSINIDLVYGLPHQSRKSVTETLARVLELEPDRIAIFGYAHLPQRLKHQRLIDAAALPDIQERYAQSQRLSRLLQRAGYRAIGIDHYARETDSLAQAPLRRNFQGYTTDTATALIGLGASSIGRLPQGYVQNAVATADYERRVLSGHLATERGFRLSNDDAARAAAIETLMCEYRFSRADLTKRFGDAAAPVCDIADDLIAADADGIVERTSEGFVVTPLGRPFVRTIASCFDAYLGTKPVAHAPGI
ncbi:MAG: oxygen-independent coproporphyrinogen III oxidase [Hyphomicrobium sp.]|nr:oxygen-independent coproporphyrinogen III oxidase [Hyphomicrobium sp.]